jgi:hypothetical protein
MENLSTPAWRKSSRSNDTGANCVEVTVVDDARHA